MPKRGRTEANGKTRKGETSLAELKWKERKKMEEGKEKGGNGEGGSGEYKREGRLGPWKRYKGWLGHERARGMGPLRRLPSCT
jgi:hypothetical protein